MSHFVVVVEIFVFLESFLLPEKTKQKQNTQSTNPTLQVCPPIKQGFFLFFLALASTFFPYFLLTGSSTSNATATATLTATAAITAGITATSTAIRKWSKTITASTEQSTAKSEMTVISLTYLLTEQLFISLQTVSYTACIQGMEAQWSSETCTASATDACYLGSILKMCEATHSLSTKSSSYRGKPNGFPQ